MYIDAHLGLQLGDTRVSLVCPGCATQSHMTPIAAPTHEELTKHPSGHIGVVYRCDACEYVRKARLQRALKMRELLRHDEPASG